MLTVAEASARLGLHPSRVRRLIAEGRIPARKHGRDWLIEDPLRDPRLPHGRPTAAASGVAPHID